jgi:hypothetical protein
MQSFFIIWRFPFPDVVTVEKTCVRKMILLLTVMNVRWNHLFLVNNAKIAMHAVVKNEVQRGSTRSLHRLQERSPVSDICQVPCSHSLWTRQIYLTIQTERVSYNACIIMAVIIALHFTYMYMYVFSMYVLRLVFWSFGCWEKWHGCRMDAQRISHVRETSHQNATSKSQPNNKQDSLPLLSTNLVRQQ